jgi:hypothetical protein
LCIDCIRAVYYQDNLFPFHGKARLAYKKGSDLAAFFISLSSVKESKLADVNIGLGTPPPDLPLINTMILVIVNLREPPCSIPHSTIPDFLLL